MQARFSLFNSVLGKRGFSTYIGRLGELALIFPVSDHQVVSISKSSSLTSISQYCLEQRALRLIPANSSVDQYERQVKQGDALLDDKRTLCELYLLNNNPSCAADYILHTLSAIDCSEKSKSPKQLSLIRNLYCLLGEAYQGKNEWGLAVSAFQNAFRFAIKEADHIISSKKSMISPHKISPVSHSLCRIPLEKLGLAYMAAGEMVQAFSAFQDLQKHHGSSQSAGYSWDLCETWLGVSSLFLGDIERGLAFQRSSLEKSRQIRRLEPIPKTAGQHYAHAIDRHNLGVMLTLSGQHFVASDQMNYAATLLKKHYALDASSTILQIVSRNLEAVRTTMSGGYDEPRPTSFSHT